MLNEIAPALILLGAVTTAALTTRATIRAAQLARQGTVDAAQVEARAPDKMAAGFTALIDAQSEMIAKQEANLARLDAALVTLRSDHEKAHEANVARIEEQEREIAVLREQVAQCETHRQELLRLLGFDG